MSQNRWSSPRPFQSNSIRSLSGISLQLIVIKDLIENEFNANSECTANATIPMARRPTMHSSIERVVLHWRIIASSCIPTSSIKWKCWGKRKDSHNFSFPRTRSTPNPMPPCHYYRLFCCGKSSPMMICWREINLLRAKLWTEKLNWCSRAFKLWYRTGQDLDVERFLRKELLCCLPTKNIHRFVWQGSRIPVNERSTVSFEAVRIAVAEVHDSVAFVRLASRRHRQ